MKISLENLYVDIGSLRLTHRKQGPRSKVKSGRADN